MRELPPYVSFRR